MPRNTRTAQEVADANLHEAIADIAYAAGHDKYYGGDSRQDMANFVDWAKEFCAIHATTDWAEVEYMDTIDAFIATKIGKE